MEVSSMLTYRRLSRKPHSFRSFTGLEMEEFDTLYGIIEGQYNAYEEERLNRKDRINAMGQGRRFTIPLKERLIMLLMYYRRYITHELESYLVGVDLSTIHRNVKHLEPLVRRCTPLPQKVHKSTRKIGTMKELLEYYPDMKAFIDGTEQPLQRPKNKKRRKSHYSGKKKRHTRKTQLIVNKKGLILHKSKSVKGSKHDYELYKETHPSIPPDVELDGDSGYQGMEKDFPGMKVRIPPKERAGKGTLSGRQEVQQEAEQGTGDRGTRDWKGKEVPNMGGNLQKQAGKV
jgi:hypothetical protein